MFKKIEELKMDFIETVNRKSCIVKDLLDSEFEHINKNICGETWSGKKALEVLEINISDSDNPQSMVIEIFEKIIRKWQVFSGIERISVVQAISSRFFPELTTYFNEKSQADDTATCVKAVKMTGIELKEVLGQVVGGIYLKRSLDFVTNIFTKFSVTESGLELVFDDFTKISIPIADDDEYINYAIACSNEDEEWEDNAYFSHNVQICGYDLLFNIKSASTELTIPQLKVLLNEKDGRYSVDSQDCNSVSMNLVNARISIDDNEICFCPIGHNVNIQMEDIEKIMNDSEDVENVHIRIELNNGMSDLDIEPSYSERRLTANIYREIK